MSVLETPRLYFKGEVTWDPITSNNDPSWYDETAAKTLFPAGADPVVAFRGQAVQAVSDNQSWNPHGTHRATFVNCRVVGLDVGSGRSVDDPIVGAGVRLTGMLVDLEPYGSVTSQIFFDKLSLGVVGGYGLSARSSKRITARYINLGRNPSMQGFGGASVIWQTSFDKKSGIELSTNDSKALQSMAAALKEDETLGLTLRFNAYLTRVAEGGPDFAAKLTKGGFQPNPARSRLVGVIGLWRRDEPALEPGDRALVPAGAGSVATIFARVGDSRLTLDLGNSIAEVDAVGTKQDLADLTIVAVDDLERNVATLGVLPASAYDRQSYEGSAGLVELPLTAALVDAARDNNLRVRNSAGTALAQETRLRAIPEMPNLYRDEGDATVAQFRVFDRGSPATRSISVATFPTDASGAPTGGRDIAVTGNDGKFTVLFPPTAGQIAGLSLIVDAGAATPGQLIFTTQTNTYMFVRTLPADADIAALPPTWENVYSRVLANWAAMAPCMDNWLPLGDEAQVRGHATLLKRLTDPARFEEFRFMPVTRDMTKGERTLLYNFLNTSAASLVAGADTAHRPAADKVAVARALRHGPATS